jgi:hypothetical protein
MRCDHKSDAAAVCAKLKATSKVKKGKGVPLHAHGGRGGIAPTHT